MNICIIKGRLTADPVVRKSQSGYSFAGFNVAVDRRLSSEKRNDPNAIKADFPHCQAIGKTAEFIEKYFHKGDMIAIEGSIQTGSYKGKDGNMIYTTDILVNNVEFCGGKNGDGNGNNQGNYQRPVSTPASEPSSSNAGWQEPGDDELPFA